MTCAVARWCPSAPAAPIARASTSGWPAGASARRACSRWPPTTRCWPAWPPTWATRWRRARSCWPPARVAPCVPIGSARAPGKSRRASSGARPIARAPAGRFVPCSGSRALGLLRLADPERRGTNGRGDPGQPADLQVHATVELLALLRRLVAQRAVLADGDGLHGALRHAQLHEGLAHGLRPLLGQPLVVLRGAPAGGRSPDPDRPPARPPPHSRPLLSAS